MNKLAVAIHNLLIGKSIIDVDPGLTIQEKESIQDLDKLLSEDPNIILRDLNEGPMIDWASPVPIIKEVTHL